MTVSEQIIEVLNYICEQVGLAIDWSVVFASENVIPYIEQLCGKFITYEIATSVVWLVLGIILAIIAAIAFKRAKKEWDNNGIEELFIILIFVGTLCSIFAAIIIVCQTFDIVTCLTFPEKILIQELKYIYNSMK